MSRLSELSKNVVQANVFTFNGAPVSSASSFTYPLANNYVQVGDAQTLAGNSVLSYMQAAFSGDNSLFAIAKTTNAAYDATSFLVYRDTSPPTKTFSLVANIPIPYATPGTTRLVTTVNANGGLVAVVGNNTDSSLGLSNGSFNIFTRPSTASNAWTLAKTARSNVPSQQVGAAVAISADGSVIAIGAPGTNTDAGAVFVYTYNAVLNTLVFQTQLVGTGAIGAASQGFAVQISSDGKTIVSSGVTDNGGVGAIWTFTQNSNGTWSQVGSKVVPTGLYPVNAAVGLSLALSGDATTMAVAVPFNTLVLNTGCVVVYNFVDGAWKQGETIYPLAASGNVNPPTLAPVWLNQSGDILSFSLGNNNDTQGATFVYNVSPETGLWVGNGVARIGTGAPIPVPGNETQGLAAMSPDGSLLLVLAFSTIPANNDPTYFWVFA